MIKIFTFEGKNNAMGLLTLSILGKPGAWDIKYSKYIEDGIAFTDAPSFVSFNCKSLKIRLNKLDNDWDDMDMLHEYPTFFVVTSRVNKKYSQHIFLSSASEGDIVEFAQKKPGNIAKIIYKRLGLS